MKYLFDVPGAWNVPIILAEAKKPYVGNHILPNFQVSHSNNMPKMRHFVERADGRHRAKCHFYLRPLIVPPASASKAGRWISL